MTEASSHLKASVVTQTIVDHIQSELKDGILRLQFQRPEKRNAFTRAMYTRLSESLVEADQNDEVRVVVLEGSGGSFSGGNDLLDFMQAPPSSEDAPPLIFLQRISQFQKPLIAKVEGSAVGIGTTLLFHCDLVYAGESAYFQMPFIELGLVAEGGSTYLLPRLMGHPQAAELLFFGERFDTQKALSLGLLTEVLPTADLAARVDERAARLAALPKEGLRITKAMMRKHSHSPLQATLVEEAKAFIARLSSEEAQAAFAAFFAKKKAK